MQSTSAESTAKPAAPPDLEIKDAQLIFNQVWKQLEDDYGRENLRFPKELILLGGAPGAGKGTNTNFIRKLRGITAEPIVVSALLDSPESQKLKSQGGMVGDREVVGILFRKLLEPEQQNGAILDGFPRTKVQVECLKLLFDEMMRLRRDFSATPDAFHFKQPIFHIMVLFVDEAESIARQLKRGQEVLAHNEEVRRSGLGELWEERATDFDPTLARNRYKVFKEKTYDALVSLKEIFHYHFINAQASLDLVQENIVRELEYQSSLELDPRTFDLLRKLPLASEIIRHARQDLVRRLDSYKVEKADLMQAVVDFIEGKMMPIIVRHSISGRADINSENTLFHDPEALAILIDIFSERGFHATADLHLIEIPERFDLQTGEIQCRKKKVFRFNIRFKGSEIRRG
ncbi:nucleoside monophosphate kinase [Prosthecobacter dejongeii]|uniref:Adenylate kinase n=1 Tax=Prosthecobacter dejongeii TaxID=48465 RepID=A0A7W8DPF6_9BACT|nr:nucleoside monophosphate kinase [Prosthecobacter dejongeii]MBB5037383.1 adenylate kinase [Prosthecobacter dejongeii]